MSFFSKIGNFFTGLRFVRFVWKLSGEFLHLVGLSSVICLADQLIKQSIDAEPADNFPRDLKVTKGKVGIIRAHNPGFTHGRLGEYPEFVKLSSLGITGFLSGILCFLCSEFPRKYRIRKLGMSMVIGGAMSNILDRARNGKVTDYLHIRLGMLKQSIINIGDIAICLGGAVYALGLLFDRD